MRSGLAKSVFDEFLRGGSNMAEIIPGPFKITIIPCVQKVCQIELSTPNVPDHYIYIWTTSRENQKTCLREVGMGQRGFRPGRTQTCLCSHRNQLEAWNLDRGTSCTILSRHRTTKALIRLRMRRLICAFVVRIRQKRLSHEMAHVLFWQTARKKYPHLVHFFFILRINKQIDRQVNASLAFFIRWY